MNTGIVVACCAVAIAFIVGALSYYKSFSLDEVNGSSIEAAAKTKKAAERAGARVTPTEPSFANQPE